MATDPFDFVVGQIVATAFSEIEQSKKAQRVEEVLQSMQGFVYLKDWRIACPREYLYAKKHKLDYSSLRKTTTSMVLKQRSAEQKAKEVANMRALKSTIYGDRSTFTFVPTVWETDEQIFVIARDEKARGMPYQQFCQKYIGAYTLLNRKGKTNQLRKMFGLKPYHVWTKDYAISRAQTFLKKHQGIECFKQTDPQAYARLVKYPKTLKTLFPDYVIPRKWTIETALAQARTCASQGYILERFRNEYAGCIQFLTRNDYLEEVRPLFDKNKEKYHLKDFLAKVRDFINAGGKNKSQLKRERNTVYQFFLKRKLLHLLDPLFAAGRKPYESFPEQLVLNSTS